MSNSSGPKPVRRIKLETAKAENSAGVELAAETIAPIAPKVVAKPAGRVAHGSVPGMQKKVHPKPQTTDTPQTNSQEETKKKLDGIFETRSRPREVRSGDESAANLILSVEREARLAESEAELRFMMVNSTRKIVNYRQGFLLSKKGPKDYVVEAISSLSAVDRNSNFVRWIEESVVNSVNENGDEEIALITAKVDDHAENPDAKSYPFGNFVLLPLKLRDGTVFAQLMLARENAWAEDDLPPAMRLVETYAHAWEALTGPKILSKRLRDKTLTAILSGVAIAAAGFLPVPLTVLAPAEVTAANPIVVAAPLNGVVEKIEVEPNSMVKKGELLFRFSDTELKNRVDVSGQDVQVAEARYLQAQRNSFSDPKAKRDLAIALSELKLKATEYDYARDLLARTEVRAPQDGLVIFSDKDDWTGRPVSTGERIMRLADPSKVELTISLPVADSIVLGRNARVRLFMDSAPLHPVEARIKNASYHAKPDIDGVLSYRTVAKFFNTEESAIPRIGLRGTAQIHGEKVPLAFYIFRKPLSVMRQWIGF